MLRMFLFFLTCGWLSGQVTTATIHGTVTDPSGSVVANAHVTISNTDTGLQRSIETADDGQYRFELLPVGPYRIEGSAAGFKKFVQSGIVLEVNQIARVDATLTLGETTETVEVQAAAPAVNTDNATLARTVGNLEITQLPIVGRNVYSLLTLAPGVQSSANTIVLGYPEQRTMINGGVDGGSGSVAYYLDGGSNMTGLRNTGNVNPSPDAVEEFRIATNGYGAEFGKFSGGVINVITKSGTNAFHGSLFEFLRNTLLNANVWSPVPVARAPLHRNQFGGTVGGPIKRDKTFFFFDYSGLRQISSTLESSAVVPTALERTGNFSQSSIKPINPLTKLPFSGGIIPSGMLDPTAKNILQTYIPLANGPGNQFAAQIPIPYNSDEVLFKVDHTLNQQHRLTASYFETTGNNAAVAGNLPWSTQQFNWHQQNANASDTWVANPETVNQLWITYSRNFGGRLNLPAISLGDLGSKFQVQGAPSLPQITVSGYFTLGQSIDGPTAGTNNYSLRDILSTTRGKHTLKVGGEMSLNKDIQQTLLNNYGTFSFTGANYTGVNISNPLASFLLGLPATMNQDAPVTALDNSWSYALFVQDDYRVTSRFTLNLGLRWDIQTPPTDPFNRASTFMAGVRSTVVPSAPLGMLFPGDSGVTRGIVPMEWTHVSPRVGLAWDPFGNGKTSIRASGGVFYGSVSGNEWNTPSNFQPFAARQQFNSVQSLTNPYGLLPGGVSPYPYSYDPQSPRFILPANLFAIAENFRWPYTYQFNFSVQREIAKDFTVTAAYVGALSHRLPFAEDINYPAFTSTATTANVNNRRPIDTGSLGSVLLLDSNMNASYHGLQFSAAKRFARHFSAQGSYTFSKTLDGAQLQNNTTQGLAEDFNNLSLEKGRADFDARHSFVGSFLWQLNYLEGANKVVRGIFNGWQFSGVVTLRSGLPFTVTTGSDTNLDGNNNDRPNLVGNPAGPQTVAEWFNTAAFAAPAKGTDGTAGRNIMDGPGLRDVDLGLFRNFRIREGMLLQARAEASNAFNLVSLTIPSQALATTANIAQSTMSSSLFGQIRSAADMRQVQIGLRLTF